MVKKISSLFVLSSFLLLTAGPVNAQTPSNDSLAKSLAQVNKALEPFKKLKITGYVQAQFQVADSVGINSYAGGNFAPNVDKRFMIRRSRVKFTHDNTLSKFVLELNGSETGVNLIEVYGKFTDPWTKTFSLTTGLMNRPFGYEIGYTSGLRETPERGRMSQIIMPNERDLGAMVTIQRPEKTKFSAFKLEAGMFNGTGRTTSDFDYYKDFIGHLSAAKKWHGDSLQLSGGVSSYIGGPREGTTIVFDHVGALASGETGFLSDTSDIHIKEHAKRTYIGADLQFSVRTRLGFTTLRAEYIQGTQPGTANSSTSFSTAPTGDIYLRNFNGAYFYFIHALYKDKLQLVVKYDWYDADSDIAGDDIKSANGFTAADLKYTTLGTGLIFHIDKHIKIMTYYDMVTNETSANLGGYHNDVKDNVFTTRVQYRF